MKWLTNMRDPKAVDAKRYLLLQDGQTREQAWEDLQRYLMNKVIGEPKATEHHSVKELTAMGSVGIYTE